MNRIKISPLATGELDNVEQLGSDSAKVSPETAGTGFRHHTASEFSLFVPQHYESSYAYPLIVWMHGDCKDSNQIHQMMPGLSVRNHVAVAPQSAYSQQSPMAWPDCEESVYSAYEQVMFSIDDATRRFNINKKRIYIAGSGSGGTMAIRLAFERPDVFAGVASIDGPLDSGCIRLRDLARCRELDVFLAGFRSSKSYTESDLCKDLKLLHTGGFSTTVRQYPGELRMDSKVLSDINRWIMEQIQSAIL